MVNRNINLHNQLLKVTTITFLFVVGFCFISHAQPFTVDKNGYVIDKQFGTFTKKRGLQLVGLFSFPDKNGLNKKAQVLKNGRWYFMDIKGNETVKQSKINSSNPYEVKGDADNDNDFDTRTYVHPSNEALKLLVDGTHYGLMNKKNNSIIIPAIYDELRLTNFNFVTVKQNGKWGTISKKGIELTKPTYDDIRSLGVFMKGARQPTGEAIIVSLNGKWGLIGVNGIEATAPVYEGIESSWQVNSILRYKLNQKWGLMKKSGEKITEPIYNQLNDFNPEGILAVSLANDNIVKYGVIDTLGTEILKPVYDYIFIDKNAIEATSGKFPNSKMDLFSTTGKKISLREYKFINKFYRGNALVRTMDNKHGFIDTTGKEIVKPIYDDAKIDASTKYIIVKINGKFGLLDATEHTLVTPIYDDLQFGSNGLLRGVINNIYYFVDLYGNKYPSHEIEETSY